MREACRIFRVRQKKRPRSPLIFGEQVRIAIPLIEVADETKRFGKRRPFAVPDAGSPVLNASVQAKVMMAEGHFAQGTAMFIEDSAKAQVMLVAVFEVRSVRLQPRIELDQRGSAKTGA